MGYFTYKWLVYWGEITHWNPITFDPIALPFRDIQVTRWSAANNMDCFFNAGIDLLVLEISDGLSAFAERARCGIDGG